MKNQFNLRRFWLYAKRHYYENKKLYIILLIVALIMPLLQSLYGFSITVANRNGVFQNYTIVYIMTLMIFSTIILLRTSRNIMSRKHDIILPASNIEKYTFMILNSSVIPFVIYTFVFFFPVISIVELFTNPYLGDLTLSSLFSNGEGFHLLSNSSSVITITENSISSFGTFASPELISKTGAIFLYITILWGVISVKDRLGVAYSIIIHTLIWLSLNSIISYSGIVISISSEDKEAAELFQGLGLMNIINYIALIVPISYIYALWRRFKNREEVETMRTSIFNRDNLIIICGYIILLVSSIIIKSNAIDIINSSPYRYL